MPLASHPQTPLGALNGRQIFIDDINESKGGAAEFGLAYSPLDSDSRQINENAWERNELVLDLDNHNSSRRWNETYGDYGRFWPFIIDMQHLVFVAMCLCLVLLVLFVIIVLKLHHIYLKWRRKRRSGPRIAIIEPQSSQTHTPQFNSNGRRSLLSRMLARIEEFDSLTPLIITPNSLSDDDHVPIGQSAVFGRHQSIDRTTTTTNSTPISFRGSPRRRPRCVAGKITLFPLASNVRRAEPYLATEIASDSGDSTRGQGNNAHRGPPAATNGVIMRNPFEDLDLVSIDRTSGGSTLDRRPTPNDLLAANATAAQEQNALASTGKQLQQQKLHYSTTALAGSSTGDVYPLSTLPSPASTDILIPASELRSSTQNLNHASASSNNKNHRPNGNNHYRFVIKRESNSIDSLTSNLSSPMDSSICGDTGSPLDTTGSLAELSDSVYMASESENSEAAKASGRIYSVDTGATQRWYTVSAPGTSGISSGEGSDRSEPDLSTFEFEAPGVKRYVLHRIEEESIDEMAAAGTTATSSAGDRSKRSGVEQSASSNGEKKVQAHRR